MRCQWEVDVRLLLVRHAESVTNAALVLSSALPGPQLTALGHRQSVQLASDLTGEPVRTVCASAALRAQQTAAPVAAAHELPVEVVDGLQETFFGDLENRGDNDALVTFYRVYSAWLDGRLDIPMPGGETGRQLVDRFRTALAGLPRRDGTVVLVSHGVAITVVVAALTGYVSVDRRGDGLANCGALLLEGDLDSGALRAGPERSLAWTSS
jgi:broad specificity phosphatase PhoE